MPNDPSGVIDFNCDMGESFGAYKMGLDEEVIRHITSANIATGFHAGDPNWMAATVALATQHGVQIGAHPAYPDLVGFGRRDMDLPPGDIPNLLTYQIGALAAFVPGKILQHVKPHGAMYNRAVRDPRLAEAVVQAIQRYDPDMIHVVLAGSLWEEIARKAGARVAREAFADRAVAPDGTLVPRSHPGAVFQEVDQVVRQVLKIATEGRVATVGGGEIAFPADTICLHGDNPEAIRLAQCVRRELERAGVTPRPMREIV